MQKSWSNGDFGDSGDSGDFLKTFKNIGKIPEGDILVTADIVGFYPNIPHGVGLEELRK